MDIVFKPALAILGHYGHAKCRAPKHTPKQTDGPGGGSGMYTLLVAEHAGRYAKPKLKRKQRDMWRTKMTVDLALKNVPALHRQSF